MWYNIANTGKVDIWKFFRKSRKKVFTNYHHLTRVILNCGCGKRNTVDMLITVIDNC